jgi:hypothetical protein
VFAGSAAQALPMDQFTLPNDSTKQQPRDSSDALFNHSVPDRWDNSATKQEDANKTSSFHFSVKGPGDYMAPRSSFGDAKAPMSEFYQPTPPVQNDPLLDNQ